MTVASYVTSQSVSSFSISPRPAKRKSLEEKEVGPVLLFRSLPLVVCCAGGGNGKDHSLIRGLRSLNNLATIYYTKSVITISCDTGNTQREKALRLAAKFH